MECPQNHYVAQINEKAGKLAYTKYDLESKAGNWFIFSRRHRNGKRETLKINGRLSVRSNKKEALLDLIDSLRFFFAKSIFRSEEKIPIAEFYDRAKCLSICADAAKRMGIKEIT